MAHDEYDLDGSLDILQNMRGWEPVGLRKLFELTGTGDPIQESHEDHADNPEGDAQDLCCDTAAVDRSIVDCDRSFNRKRIQQRRQMPGVSPEVMRLQDQIQRLTEHNHSLKAMYCQMIAQTESACANLLKEKDDERNQWYKDKINEMQKLKATMVIAQ